MNMMTTKIAISSEKLINACSLGQYNTLKYYLNNFDYSPQIYSYDNKCLYEAFFTVKYDDLVLLLCEKVPNITYFEDSAKNWPEKTKILHLIEQSKALRLMNKLNIALPGKDKAIQIKI